MAGLQVADNKVIGGILFFSSFYPLLPYEHKGGNLGGMEGEGGAVREGVGC